MSILVSDNFQAAGVVGCLPSCNRRHDHQEIFVLVAKLHDTTKQVLTFQGIQESGGGSRTYLSRDQCVKLC